MQSETERSNSPVEKNHLAALEKDLVFLNKV